MKITALLAVLPAAIAAPGSQTFNSCNAIDWLVNANHGSAYASSFCSTYLGVKTSTVTQSATTTVTGSTVTKTSTATAQATATTTSVTTTTSVVTKQSTTYLTSTCTPAGTPAAATSTSGVQKRGSSNYCPDKWSWSWNWPYKSQDYQPTQISSACSCIVTTPTAYVTKTSTVSKAGPTTTTTTTTTVTSTSTAYSTKTAVSTTTQVTTSTQIEPISPTGTYTSPDGTVFDDYNNVDFIRGDLDGGDFCPCDSDPNGPAGPCNVRGVTYEKCSGFNSCQDICADINDTYGNLTCVGVTYQGADASGNCYFKSSLEGCGMYNDGRRSGLIELNNYKYTSKK